MIAVVPVGDSHYARTEHVISNNFNKTFDTLEEARYENMLKTLKNGADLNIYSNSPFYEYYVDRLKKEHPEYFI